MFYSILLFLNILISDLSTVRNLYASANNSEKEAKEFIEYAKKLESSNENILKAYYAGSVLLESKFQKKIIDKKKLFQKGAKLLEEVISKNSSNIEMRLIRLSVQENAPKITGYNKNIKEDKLFILSNFKNQNSELKNYLKKFILQSKSFTPTEKKSI